MTAAPSQALPITDIYTPSSPVTIAFGSPHEYQHSLIAHGFDPLTELLSSVTLTLSITGANGQELSVALDGDPEFSGTLNTLLLGQPLTVTLSYVQNDGLLNVKLTKTQNNSSDFTLNSSTLFAAGRDPETLAHAPEPASLLLFGVGVTFLAHRMRRRRANDKA